MDTLELPVLFVSHGAPTFALDAGSTGPALRAFGQTLQALGSASAPALRGVLVMSPHWMTRIPLVMSAAQPRTLHDFGGFPAELYRLQYPAPGAPALAEQVIALLQASGVAAQADPQRPFDHGAWVPLLHLLPEAQVPVLQLSLPAHADAQALVAIGLALAGLRAQGILIVASGSMTHNLAEFFNGSTESTAYVDAFSRWVEAALLRGDLPALLDYRAQAPQAQRAHPTEEHFLPLFFALGAARFGAARAVSATYLSREVMHKRLAMDAIAFA